MYPGITITLLLQEAAMNKLPVFRKVTNSCFVWAENTRGKPMSIKCCNLRHLQSCFLSLEKPSITLHGTIKAGILSAFHVGQGRIHSPRAAASPPRLVTSQCQMGTHLKFQGAVKDKKHLHFISATSPVPCKKTHKATFRSSRLEFIPEEKQNPHKHTP